MPDSIYVCRNTVFAATAGTKTALKILAGANQPIEVRAWGLSMDGATSSAVPATVTWEQSTEAGAGTAGASPPAVVQVAGRTVASQFTEAHNFTAEPTVLTPVEQSFRAQYMGEGIEIFEGGSEIETDLSGGTIKALCLRVNVSANVNVLCWARVGVG